MAYLYNERVGPRREQSLGGDVLRSSSTIPILLEPSREKKKGRLSILNLEHIKTRIYLLRVPDCPGPSPMSLSFSNIETKIAGTV